MIVVGCEYRLFASRVKSVHSAGSSGMAINPPDIPRLYRTPEMTISSGGQAVDARNGGIRLLDSRTAGEKGSYYRVIS